jgi:hypothetical protein
MKLATRFGKNSAVLRSPIPLTDEEIRAVAPSIFADGKHESRSDRYTYIPTIQVLDGLRKEGFSPFMVCQTRVRDEGKREHAKHMIRLRHANQIEGTEANEIILLNSHDGSSSYQMLSGVFRFVCQNGMVCGETHSDIRVPHKGNIVDNVIEGACRVLDDFEKIESQMDSMKSVALDPAEQEIFARSALMLKYDEQTPSPVTEEQVLRARRTADASDDLWSTFNRLQENMIRGGLRGRAASGRAISTRPVQGIDQNVKLNRALWSLSEAMLKLKGAC